MSNPTPRYRRVLLKVSGEGFCKPGSFGVDPEELVAIATEIAAAARVGAQLAVVVGGGNIIRGQRLAEAGQIAQASADYMGMLGTVINGLALKEALEKQGVSARVVSALSMTSVAEPYVRNRVIRHLEKNRVVIFVAGTGNPFFTTDTAAALRAAEIGADVVLKATKVDGIYDRDPKKFPDAKKYASVGYEEAITKKLGVMDLAAFSLCMERKIPIVVFDMNNKGNIAGVVAGAEVGTRVG